MLSVICYNGVRWSCTEANSYWLLNFQEFCKLVVKLLVEVEGGASHHMGAPGSSLLILPLTLGI